ncbi:MAG: hypothetical protein MZW92_71460 [Comamonadaceae bacterium]|nr:hypothetical protein [Comamonadaceae bacterium]
MFDDDEAVIRQGFGVRDDGKNAVDLARFIGGIDEDDIEGCLASPDESERVVLYERAF